MSRERVQELEVEIRRHSELYHNGMPEITDAEFDELIAELKELAPESPALAEVGALPAWGRKVKHPSLMGSLDLPGGKPVKETEVSDLIAWYQGLSNPAGGKLSLIASTKVDGLATRLRYVNGELVEGATRGDGQVGQDILDNVKEIKSIPNTVAADFSGEVRGEVYMSKEVWESFGSKFANPRNGAAGSLLQKDSKETGRRKLDFLAYSLKEDGKEFETERHSWARAEGLGFDYVKWESVEVNDLEAFILEWENEKRPNLPFQIDGLVFTVDLFAAQEEAGWNGKRPRGKVAWKFKPEQREASVLGVTWQVGRTGKLTPVLHIEPTKIDGSTISNVTIGSAGRFEELGLGRGDKVLVEKAGDIIPQVVRVTWRPLKSPKMEAPETCPDCGSTVGRPPTTDNEEGAHLFCQNPACGSQLRRRIHHWLTRMDVKGAGPSIVSAMCDIGIVSGLADLYYMKAEDLQHATGSLKIAEAIIREIAMKSEMPFSRFMSGLGVPALGQTASKSISKHYSSIEEVIEADVMGLMRIDGIGETTANQIISGLIAMAREIEALERTIDIEEPVIGGPLAGMSFCITGKLSRGKKEIAAEIEAAGGEMKSSVSKGLGFLIQADPTSESGKTKKAAKYGTKVISEDDLMEMMSAE